VSNYHYEYHTAEAVWSDAYIAPRVLEQLRADGSVRSVLDAGCGNGNLAARIAAAGFEVVAFDPSASAIEHARTAYSNVQFEVASGYDDLRERLGRSFDACIAVEVIEHLYDPREFVGRIFDILRPGGRFILSTPYHGYLKNLALAVTGKMDGHYTALWDGGHIKFWSRATLTAVLEERGFQVIDFQGAGRLPLVWKSMIVTARKPPSA
jgi:2-polyprenyl-6-hydroxyphenyl methylase/3-demethylubiquinone-9 3-methyltransferase